MKKIIISLTVVTFIGCGENRNQLMTTLINERKVFKDSMNVSNNKMKNFTDSAIAISKKTHDTSLFNPLFDSASLYLDNMIPIESRLKALDFSIDSLSKMK